MTWPRVLSEKKLNTQALNTVDNKAANQEEELHTTGGEVKEKDILECL